jgi:hypothetical protein
MYREREVALGNDTLDEVLVVDTEGATTHAAVLSFKNVNSPREDVVVSKLEPKDFPCSMVQKVQTSSNQSNPTISTSRWKDAARNYCTASTFFPSRERYEYAIFVRDGSYCKA